MVEQDKDIARPTLRRTQESENRVRDNNSVEPMVESRTGKRAEHAGSTMLALSRSALALDGACLVA
jgi:hypothetical protein